MHSAQEQSADVPDGFGVAVVREDGKWRCTAMQPAALTSLAAAETELRELRSAGAVFGLLDIDDEFFVIVRPAPAGTRLLLSDATAALDYDIAAEVLEKLDADIDDDDLEDADPFEEGDLGLLSDIGLPEAVLGVILAESDDLRRRAAGPDRPGDGLRRRTGGGARQTRSVSSADEALIRRRAGGRPAAGPRDVPIGAVVFAADGAELARAANAREELGDPTAHAEILALRAAAGCSATAGGWKARRWR